MAPFELSPDRLRVLRAVHAHGASVCVGTCEHHSREDGKVLARCTVSLQGLQLLLGG
jgi:hypothetical protein